MKAHARLRASVVALTLFAAAAADTTAQQIRGRVVVQGSDEPVAAATVALLDAELNPVLTARTGETGEFSFTRLNAGLYYVQADRDGVQSALSGSIQLAATDATVTVEMPSRMLVLAMTCGAETETEASTVLVGTVSERMSGVALPNARLKLTWDGAELDAVADGIGHFRFCDVPVARDLTLSAEVWGRSITLPIRLAPASVSRIDVPLDVGAIQFAVAVTQRVPTTSSSASLLVTVRDAASGTPLRGAALWFGSSSMASFTNSNGVVRLEGVAPGDHTLRVEMVGYGSRSAPVEIPAGENLHLEVRVPAVPVELEPISVNAHMRSEFRTPREATSRVDILAGRQMALAESRGAQMIDLIRGSFPGVFIHQGTYSTMHNPHLERIVCVESLRRLDRLRLPDGMQEPFCDMVTVILDGAPVFQPGQFLLNMSVRDVESVEFLSPLDAGIRYGNRASQAGALVIWSRGRGPHRTPARQGN
jgi:hypothetical protein